MKQKEGYQSASGATAAVSARDVTITAGQSREIDERIDVDFRKSYVYKTFLASDSIDVAVKDGIVTLTGTVTEEAHKVLAQETITHLPGVVGVENKLATPKEIAAESADTWIGRKVKLNLLFHFHVNATATTVAVKDRVVTLTGVASNMAQKELTTEYARDIEGVKEVRNEMTMAAHREPEKRTVKMQIDDASIVAQVNVALMTHRSTSAMKAQVKTRDGTVSVTGIARNAAEKALITKIVSDIHGVSSVNNQMTVEDLEAR